MSDQKPASGTIRRLKRLKTVCVGATSFSSRPCTTSDPEAVAVSQPAQFDSISREWLIPDPSAVGTIPAAENTRTAPDLAAARHLGFRLIASPPRLPSDRLATSASV
uniref:Aldo/keto reductase n=1 Tax=Panagrellus redivivus TaxID=6233 RepID=A0A7E4W129_PANRE